jgi:hypothetical protein
MVSFQKLALHDTTVNLKQSAAINFNVQFQPKQRRLCRHLDNTIDDQATFNRVCCATLPPLPPTCPQQKPVHQTAPRETLKGVWI